MPRRAVTVLIVVTAAMLLGLFGWSKVHNRGLVVKTYFDDAKGLREGAPVRLAGVDIGRVTSVRARPEMRDSPAEVVMLISTPYPLNIPRDATVSLARAGLLGETYPQIEIQAAGGPPAVTGAVLLARRPDAVGATSARPTP